MDVHQSGEPGRTYARSCQRRDAQSYAIAASSASMNSLGLSSISQCPTPGMTAVLIAGMSTCRLNGHALGGARMECTPAPGVARYRFSAATAGYCIMLTPIDRIASFGIVASRAWTAAAV